MDVKKSLKFKFHIVVLPFFITVMQASSIQTSAISYLNILIVLG